LLSERSVTKRRALLVRSEALFTDAIERLLSDFSELEITILDFQQGCETIPKLQPEVILVDGCLPTADVDQVLSLARDLRECRVIMLNPARNDFILVNSHKTTIRKVEDLMNAIRGEKSDFGLDRSASDHLQYAAGARLRAEMYGFLANMFNQRPDTQFVRQLRMLGTGAFSISTKEEMSLEVSRGLHEMGSFVEATMADSEQQVQETLAVDWTRLFRGVSPQYGPAPPYEGVYIEGAGNPAEILQSIMQIYHEYAVDVDEKAANRPDYIGIELDFLRHLNEKEAEAWAGGENETAQSYQEAGRNFLLNHVWRWACKFCELAIEEAKTDFYQGFLRLTKGVLNEEINSFSSIR
jgi:TorA maturation chaperone TorD